jgi:hypothetical protein
MAENFLQFKVLAAEGQTPRGSGYSRRCYILAFTDSCLDTVLQIIEQMMGIVTAA